MQAALRLRYVQYAGGWYAQRVRALRRPRGVRVSSGGSWRRIIAALKAPGLSAWLGLRQRTKYL